jgi:hypothetical protein
MDFDPISPTVVPVRNGQGRANGPTCTDRFSRWFRYSAGFSRDSLERAFDTIALPPGSTIVDPFAGVATAGISAIERGLGFTGIEAHVQIAELARLKFASPRNARLVRREATGLARNLKPAQRYAENELILRCFEPDILSELVAIRRRIQRKPRSISSLLLKWALLATLRDVAAVQVSWPYQLPRRRRIPRFASPLERFEERVEMMASDLDNSPNRRVKIIASDARRSGAWKNLRVDGCVTSPPYLNNYDYADATRLEMYFWRAAASWADLCTNFRDGMIIATTQQTSARKATRAWPLLREYPSVHDEAKSLASDLKKKRDERGRGKTYDLVLPAYLLDISYVLKHLYKSVKPGGNLVWIIGDSAPYGTYIDTPKLIGDLAQYSGFDLCSDEELRLRGLRWRSNGSRHQLRLAERMLHFRKPS